MDMTDKQFHADITHRIYQWFWTHE